MVTAIQKLRSITSFAETVWKLLGLIGWQPIIAAVILSCVGWLSARLQGVPTSIAIMAATPVFVSVLYLLKLPAFITGTSEIAALRRADHKLWARLDRYTLGHAACLMANAQPIDNPASVNATISAYYQLIEQAIRTGSLPAHTPNLPTGQQDPFKIGQGMPTWWAAIWRTDLQKFCTTQRGLTVPLFLRDPTQKEQ
jgi:hypothetical protein